MPGTPSHTTTIARFDTPPEEGTWPAQRAVDALIRECSRLLFAECREDLWAWLSESDLQGMLYAILRRELPAHGLAASAVTWPTLPHHAEQAQRLGRGRTLTTDLVPVVPQSLFLRGRRWTGRLVAAVEVAQYDAIARFADLAKLAAVRNVWEDVLTYMVVMGHQSAHEAVSAVEREAAAHGVTLLADNYWVQDARINQPELV